MDICIDSSAFRYVFLGRPTWQLIGNCHRTRNLLKSIHLCLSCGIPSRLSGIYTHYLGMTVGRLNEVLRKLREISRPTLGAVSKQKLESLTEACLANNYQLLLRLSDHSRGM
jgi:hypothetical protein